MILFPLIAAAISALCALLIGLDAWRRPRPDKVAWTVSFTLFALAAGAEVAGSAVGWTELLARVYYVSGAILVVGYLALGQLYLLFPRQIGTAAPGVTLLVTAVAIALVQAAPIDPERLELDGWRAIERGPALVALAAGVNGLGTAVIVGGLGYSAWRFRQRGTQRNRMIGCLLIAAGTLVVALGGTLTRFGRHEYLYIAMALGVAIIFTGYLATRRPDQRGMRGGSDRRQLVYGLSATPASNGAVAPDPAITFLEGRLLLLDDAALDAECQAWSVERQRASVLTRGEARAAWALRLRLSPAGQRAFDEQTVPAKRQLVELYDEVLCPATPDTKHVSTPTAIG